MTGTAEHICTDQNVRSFDMTHPTFFEYADENFDGPAILTGLEAYIRAMPERKRLFVLDGWQSGQEFGYVQAPIEVQMAAQFVAYRAANGAGKPWILSNIAVVKEYRDEDGFETAARDFHIEPWQFFDATSLVDKEDPYTLDMYKSFGPDNLSALITTHGTAKLIQRRLDDGLPAESSVDCRRGTTHFMSNDILHRIEPITRRGLLFLAFDHRLRPVGC